MEKCLDTDLSVSGMRAPGEHTKRRSIRMVKVLWASLAGEAFVLEDPKDVLTQHPDTARAGSAAEAFRFLCLEIAIVVEMDSSPMGRFRDARLKVEFRSQILAKL